MNGDGRAGGQKGSEERVRVLLAAAGGGVAAATVTAWPVVHRKAKKMPETKERIYGSRRLGERPTHRPTARPPARQADRGEEESVGRSL